MTEVAAGGDGQHRPDRGGSPGPVPDLVLLGVMKAGSTTLFRRLEAHPAIAAGGAKEPNFFSRDENFVRGTDWYRAQLSGEPGLRCDGSVEYSDPDVTALAMRRLHEANPDVRLLLVVRHPLDRLRSHYRHQVQRSRERRPLAEAVLDPGNPYVRRSRYTPALAAVDATFGRDQLLVVATEDLDRDENWDQILGHLGVEVIPRPTAVRNESSGKEGFRPATLALWERGWGRRAKRLPKPVRRAARRLFLRGDQGYDDLLAGADAPLPDTVVTALAQDALVFSTELGWPACPWSFDADRAGGSADVAR